MPLPVLFQQRLEQIIPAPLRPKGDFSFKPKAYAAFRINTLKTGVSEVFDYLRAMPVEFEPMPWYPSGFWVPLGSHRAILDSPLGVEGKVYAQGAQSMIPVMALDPKPGERVLDLCAAPGSKTSQIAAHMQNTGVLVANEPIRSRFYRLKAVLELTGAKAQTTMVDGRRFRINGDNPLFDRVLVDAPCSSEGRFNVDDPKSVGYWSLRKIEEMAHKQKGLLLNASRLVKPGGVLVYATCTFAPEENEEVLDWFLRKTDGAFEIAPLNFEGLLSYPALPAWGKRQFDAQTAHALRICPTSHQEGFFTAKIIRKH